jgi:single-stranded-DNA-specific exonuclease
MAIKTEQSSQALLWVYPKEDANLIKSFVADFNIHPVMAQSLISRGYRKKQDVHQFLYAKLLYLHSPNLLQDIDKAVERIYKALKEQEKIIVVGDNDVDGMTGTVLLIDFLRTLGVKAYYYIPHRSLNRDEILEDACKYATEKGCTLLITVDCGVIESPTTTLFAERGIDLIITDHHEPTEKIANCVATLNPKLFNSTYPNRDLTGVGVAFKLAHALMNHLVDIGDVQADLIDLKRYLDLVALGTIADMGALKGENRILVKYGLQHLKKTHRIGLLKLIHVSEVNPEELTTIDVATKIAPRLNSLGRIGDPLKGVELLLLRDVLEAESLAKELDVMNHERQKIERRDSNDLELYLHVHPEVFNEKAIFLSSTTWHPGIIAILTARLTKQYNRPTVIITKDGEVAKGSIRTISEFPILSTLKENSNLLLSYGGHDYAAGFTIEPEHIPTFKENFIKSVNTKLKTQDIYPKLRLDAKVSFKDLTFEFLESLSLLEPYGIENPKVILYAIAKQVLPPKVLGKKNLKFSLEEEGRFLEGIGFNMAHLKHDLLRKDLSLMIAFTPQVNVYLNKSSIQLQIIDFKIIADPQTDVSKTHAPLSGSMSEP